MTFESTASTTSELLPTRPSGEFMTPLALKAEHISQVPRVPGCYFIYLDDQPYYAGMSRTNMRARIRAHSNGRGSKMIRQMLQASRVMYFEYCAVDPEAFSATSIDIARSEFWFMLLLTGELLPGNLKVDGLSLVPEIVPIVPGVLPPLCIQHNAAPYALRSQL